MKIFLRIAIVVGLAWLIAWAYCMCSIFYYQCKERLYTLDEFRNLHTIRNVFIFINKDGVVLRDIKVDCNNMLIKFSDTVKNTTISNCIFEIQK